MRLEGQFERRDGEEESSDETHSVLKEKHTIQL